jgi:hypothetical protein
LTDLLLLDVFAVVILDAFDVGGGTSRKHHIIN